MHVFKKIIQNLPHEQQVHKKQKIRIKGSSSRITSLEAAAKNTRALSPFHQMHLTPPEKTHSEPERSTFLRRAGGSEHLSSSPGCGGPLMRHSNRTPNNTCNSTRSSYLKARRGQRLPIGSLNSTITTVPRLHI